MRIKVDGLQPNQQYAIQLRSVAGGEVSGWSRTFVVNTDPDLTIPSTPTGFSWGNDETTAHFGSWNAVTTNTDGSPMTDFSYYEIFLQTGAGVVGKVKTKDTKFTLTQEENKSLFDSDGYAAHIVKAQVRAVDIYGNTSDYTSLITSTNSAPPAAQNVNAVGVPDAVRVQWDSPAPMTQDFWQYTVHRNVGGGVFLPTYKEDGPGSNEIWRGHATSMFEQSQNYTDLRYYKVVSWDVYGLKTFNNTSAADNAKPLHAAGAGDGGPPSGPAGGDLTGTYPNPTVGSAAITNPKLADASVGTAKIIDGSVTEDKIQNFAVTTPKIGGLAVTTSKIADSAVTDVQLASNAVTAIKIGSQAVSTAKIALGAVTDAQVALANKDGLVSTYSLRTLGTGAQQAAAGNDIRLSDDRKNPSVRVATTTTGPLSSAYAAGQVVDGITLATGDRILIKDQSTLANNGVYICAASGSPTRASDNISASAVWFVEEGATQADTAWLLTTNNPITVGVTSLLFTRFGASTTYTGTLNRINVSGSVIDISSTYLGQTSIVTLGTVTTGTWNATAIAVASGGTGAITPAAARTNLGAVGKFIITLGALTAGAEVVITHNLGTTEVGAFFRDSADGYLILGWRTIDANSIGVTANINYSASAVKAVVLG